MSADRASERVKVCRVTLAAALMQVWTLAICCGLFWFLFWLKPRVDNFYFYIPMIMLSSIAGLAAYGAVRCLGERIVISTQGITDEWLWGKWHVERDRIRGMVPVAAYVPLFIPGRDYYAVETNDGKTYRIDRIFGPEDDLRAEIESIIRENTASI